jgi:hypothetical protein
MEVSRRNCFNENMELKSTIKSVLAGKRADLVTSIRQRAAFALSARQFCHNLLKFGANFAQRPRNVVSHLHFNAE